MVQNGKKRNLDATERARCGNLPSHCTRKSEALRGLVVDFAKSSIGKFYLM